MLCACLFAARAHAEPCPSVNAELEGIEQALAELELERAAGLADEAVERLGCQEQPVNTLSLALLMHAAGVAALFGGDQDLARERFAWAVAISPTSQPDPLYGQTVLALYEVEQQQLMDRPAASMLVSGADELWVDGRSQPSGPAIDLLAGAHLLQWRVGGSPLQARMVVLESGERHELLVGEAAIARAEEEAASGVRWPRAGLRVGSALCLVGAGAMFFSAARSRQAFYDASEPEALEGHLQRNHGYTLAGVGLTAVGGAGLGVSFFVAGGPVVAVGGRF